MVDSCKSTSIVSSSVGSSYKSFANSILRTPGSISQGKSQRVTFQLTSDLHNILENYITKDDVRPYEELVGTIKECVVKDDDLCAFLIQARMNIRLLSKHLHLFVNTLLKLKWAHRTPKMSTEYGTFLVDLLSTHNYYTKSVLEELISTFKGEECYETSNGEPTEVAKQCCENLHRVLEIILRIIPMASGLLCEIAKAQYPYLRRDSKEHASYTNNILKITHYYPELRCELFHLIIERLIMLDVHAPRTEIIEFEKECETEATECEVFQMEDSSPDIKEFCTLMRMKHPIANTLDISLECVFRYMYSACHDTVDGIDILNWKKTSQFYQELLTVFEAVILPTDATHHIQFLLFYICSFDATLVDEFLDFLWNKALSDNVDLVIKLKAVSYIASFLARAVHVTVSVTQKTLAKITAWIHTYIDRREGMDFIMSELRMHPIFYSVCQAVFYVVAFRHHDLLNPKQNLEILKKLNLARIVTSQLNPLKFCLPEVVHYFAAVASSFQLAYCESVIEHNSRNVLPVIHTNDSDPIYHDAGVQLLDSFFPFDPFILVRSRVVIVPLYRQYLETQVEPLQQTSRRPEEDDDFISEQMSVSIPKNHEQLSEKEIQSIAKSPTLSPLSSISSSLNFSSSPGFKHM